MIDSSNLNSIMNNDQKTTFGYHEQNTSSFKRNSKRNNNKKIGLMFGLFVLVLLISGGGIALFLTSQKGSGDLRQDASMKAGLIKADPAGFESDDDELDYVPNMILVKTRDSEPVLSTLSRVTAQLAEDQDVAFEQENPVATVAQLDRIGLVTLDQAEEQDLNETIQLLEEDESIEYAEPVYLAKYTTVNDSYYKTNEKSGLDYFQWNLNRINIEGAWDLLPDKGSSQVIAAVIDSGVAFMNYTDPQTGVSFGKAPELSHINFVAPASIQSLDCELEPLADTVVTQYAGDYRGHGTHVAGTIAQATNNSAHAAGIAAKTSIMPIRVGHPCAGGEREEVISVLDIALGVIHAVDNGAKVINMSIGVGGDATVLREAIEYAYDNEVTVIVSSGNDAENSTPIMYPAAYPETISVGATAWDNSRASYSQYIPRNGVGVDIMAPGGELVGDDGYLADVNEDKLFDGIVQQTMMPGDPDSFTEVGNYLQVNPDVGYYCLLEVDGEIEIAIDECGLFQGTSMAAPHVTGVVALMLAANPDLSPDEVRAILLDSAQWHDGYNASEYGAGLVDAQAAVASSLGTSPTTEPTETPSVTPEPTETPSVTPEPTISESPTPEVTPDPDVTCNSPSDCDDDNECTLDLCVSPGTANALCQHQVLAGNICNSGSGICDENGQCTTLEDIAVVSFQVALDGIPYCEGESCHHPLENGREVDVQVMLISSMEATITKNISLKYDQTSKTYKSKSTEPLILTSINPGPYMVVLKGPMHLGTRYCYYGSKAGNSCTLADLVNASSNYDLVKANQEMFVWLETGKAFNLDFSKHPVKVGDFPISAAGSNTQDGKADVKDYSFMLSCLGNKSRTDSCITRADVDYSGQVNNIDLGLLRKTLTEVADQI